MYSNGSKQSTLSVVITDHHSIVRHALRAILEATGRFTVVGEASDAEHTPELVRTLKPNLLLLNTDECELSFVQSILSNSTGTKVVALASPTAEKNREAVAAGALGCVTPQTSLEDFLQTLNKLLEGQVFTGKSSTVASPVVLKEAADINGNLEALALLSKREREVFYLLADGIPNRVIAKQLFVSPRTVETHRARVIKKLGLNSTAGLIRYAIRHNLLAP